MKQLSIPFNDRVIVGSSESDDAGVYRLSDGLALVQTVDFITPVVDDPFLFGKVAATNSLSDVYAMGGRPLTARNIGCFPIKKFTLDRLGDVLKGGLSVIESAGVQLLGGHSVEDEEFKYGLSVTGTVHPDRVIRNTGLRDGDVIVLTKPLGTGIVGTAVKAAMAGEDIITPYVKSMTTLNDVVPALAERFTIHACTDVTGFGLAGHLKEMMGSDAIEVSLFHEKLYVLPGALDNAAMGLIPAGMYRNREFVGDMVSVENDVPQEYLDVIFDPQTSGGLLLGIRKSDSDAVLAFLHERGHGDSAEIAMVAQGGNQAIKIF